MNARTQLILLVCLAAMVMGFHLALKQRPDESMLDQMALQAARPKMWQGKVAPDFELVLRDGSTFRLSDEVGKKVVVLNFFATWCAPCRAEMPELTRYAAALKEEPFVLIGIDAREEAALVDRFIRDVGVGFPVGIDDGTILGRYGVQSYPTTVLIGADGRVRLYETTAIMNAEVALEAPVRSELARLRDGEGISREEYLANLEREQFDQLQTEPSEDKDKLTGRAAEIAARTPCVCGCEHMLPECDCKVGKQMRARVRELSLDQSKSDVAIMELVNGEFCMKEM